MYSIVRRTSLPVDYRALARFACTDKTVGFLAACTQLYFLCENPKGYTLERLSFEIGLFKVGMFPGEIEVSKDMDCGIASLNGCSRLIVDLRGNTGGEFAGSAL